MTRALCRATALVPTLLALGSFLLPSGWAICIGPQGHLAVEPAVQVGPTCCASPGAPRGAESCVPDPDSDCEDIALDAGAARPSRPDPATGSAPASHGIVTLPGTALPRPTCLAPTLPAADGSPFPSPGARSPILRC